MNAVVENLGVRSLERLTDHIEKLPQRDSVFLNISKRTAIDFESFFKKSIPAGEGLKIMQVGSFAAGLNVDGSDLDYLLYRVNEENNQPDEEDPSRPLTRREIFDLIFRVRNWLYQNRLDFSRDYTYCRVFVIRASVPIVRFEAKTHGGDELSIDIAFEQYDSVRNTQLLACYSKVDDRVPQLLRYLKQWASAKCVVHAPSGRLNALSVCYLMISFLQVGVSPPVVPNIQAMYPELNGEYAIVPDKYSFETEVDMMTGHLERIGYRGSDNTMSLGELLVRFFDYYVNFDFDENWISIKGGAVLERTMDGEGGSPWRSGLIVIEDPFCQQWKNCGHTVHEEYTLELIKRKFGRALDTIRDRKHLYPRMRTLDNYYIESTDDEDDCFYFD